MKFGKILLTIVIVVAVVAGAVMLLQYNKTQMQEKVKSTEKQTTIPVTVTEVKLEKLEDALTLVGVIQPFAEVNILSETQGRVNSINLNVGDRVGAGKVLAVVDDELKRASLQGAQANFEKAKKDLERNEQLWKEKSITEAQLDAVKLAYQSAEAQLIISKRQLADTRIISGASGTVTVKNIEKGSVVTIGTPICTIVDVSKLKVKVNVSEQDAFKLKVGDEVEITSDVYPGKTFTGKIKTINAKGDEAHTYPVEIYINNNREYPLRAGMFARIAFSSLKSSETITIPRSAIIGSIKTPQVYVVENGIAKLKKISLGMETTTSVQVIEGLKAGEQIIISGQNILRDNTPVSIIKNEIKKETKN